MGRESVQAESRAVAPEGDRYPAVAEEQVVWMFGTRRTGSTWLGFMLRDLPGGHKWGEPLIGGLIGDFYYRFEDKTGGNHIFSPKYRDLWQSWIRRLVCEGAAARAPGMVSGGGYMVIRDPHGTVGAPVLCEAMPRSKLIILVRDPRDVVASMADAHQGGGWMGMRAKRQGRAQRHDGRHNAEADPVSFVRSRTQRVVKEFEQATLAHDIHRGPKTLVRYEDLRVDTVAEVTRVCRELELEADAGEIERVVTEHSWEQVPDEEKGSGKFHRKASPGSWKDDLDSEQVRIIERLATPILDTYYEGWRDAPGEAAPTRLGFARHNKT